MVPWSPLAALLTWCWASPSAAFSEELCPRHPVDRCGECGGSLCCKARRLSQRLHDVDTSQHTVQLLSTPRVTPFYFEMDLNEFGIDDLERGLKFAEPSEVLRLCLDFLRLPRLSVDLEQHLSRCSRAMLSLAKVADVVGPLGGNRSCSIESIRARYPLKLEDEALYEGLDEKRFLPGQGRFPDLVSGWKLFAMLANHSQICRPHRPHGCAVFNPWEPRACFKHHELIEKWSPSCAGVTPQIPRRSKVLKVGRDWLGISHDCSKGTAQDQPELTRRFECWGLPWGPLPGEDYFETISLLQAVSAATQRFVLVEAGSSSGYWSLKAAKAFRQKLPEEASCDLILIDSEYPMAKTAEHLRENSIYDLCNISLYQAPATASLLDQLVQAFGSINMIHVDIQSAELDLLRGSGYLSKVQALHVGTHSRDLHHNVREELLARDFSIDFDYSPFSFVRTAYGPVAFMDGLLAARRVKRIGIP